MHPPKPNAAGLATFWLLEMSNSWALAALEAFVFERSPFFIARSR